jgi:polyferredoxin
VGILGKSNTLYEPIHHSGVLSWPGIGRFLRWRHGRLAGQLLLLLVVLLILYDGFTGPQIASENTATNIVWLQFRGFVMLALLFAGNLFCMNCPFALPRSLARRWSIFGPRWPRFLRNKWLAFGVLFIYLYLYEWLDLWASPWLTAWIVVFYFLLAFSLEFIFSESPFCKYVCPLGSFNYIGSTVSPLQVSVASQNVCRECVGKECVNGEWKESGKWQMLGCGTELFPPQLSSNLDCTFCLDCARACPYDNVSLASRPILHELRQPKAWPYRWDLSLLIWLFTSAALSNAFGMTPPIYATVAWLGQIVRVDSEALALLLIFAFLNIFLPLVVGLAVSWTSRTMAKKKEPLRVSLSKHTPALVPIGFAVWLAHYGFHFATGALSIIPALQNFFIDHGILLFGRAPFWTLSNIVPFSWLLPLQVLIIVLGFAGSYFVLAEIGRHEGEPLSAQLPWLILLLGLAVIALYLFTLPMEMRGTGFMH